MDVLYGYLPKYHGLTPTPTPQALRKKIKTKTETRYFKVKYSMVNILVAEPRLLIVMIRSTWVHLMCVVCHGPHKDDPDPDASDAYWKWAAVKDNNHVHNATAVILLTDSNAQWDSTNTAAMQHYQHYAHFLETTHITDLVHHDQVVRRSVFTFFTTHDDGIQLNYIGV